jgi:hypothetical protein
MSKRVQLPGFDPAAITFPSDAITLGQMRRHDPEAFSSFSRLMNARADEIDAIGTHGMELVLAESAFARAAGVSDPHAQHWQEEYRSLLNDAYKEYGLSTGIQQTRQLVREFEAQAARQAENLRGRSR